MCLCQALSTTSRPLTLKFEREDIAGDSTEQEKSRSDHCPVGLPSNSTSTLETTTPQQSSECLAGPTDASVIVDGSDAVDGNADSVETLEDRLERCLQVPGRYRLVLLLR